MAQITRNVRILHQKAGFRTNDKSKVQHEQGRKARKKARLHFAPAPAGGKKDGKRSNARGAAHSVLEKLVASRAHVSATEDATSGTDQLAATFTAKINDAFVHVFSRVSENVGVGPGTCNPTDPDRCNVRVSVAESTERSVHQKAMTVKKQTRDFNHDRISCAGNVASGERAAEDVGKAALKKFKKKSKSLDASSSQRHHAVTNRPLHVN